MERPQANFENSFKFCLVILSQDYLSFNLEIQKIDGSNCLDEIVGGPQIELERQLLIIHFYFYIFPCICKVPGQTLIGCQPKQLDTCFFGLRISIYIYLTV